MPEHGQVIRTIVRMIRENRFTREECTRALGLTPEQLGNRLALMERQGYLIRERSCVPEPGDQTCRGCCLPCRSSGAGVAGYGLTEKGRRLAEAGVTSVIPSTVTDLPEK